MSRDLVLLDSDVLVDALNEESDRFIACRTLLDDAAAGLFDAVVVPQILVETYAVLTGGHLARQLSPRVAADQIDILSGMLVILPVLPESVRRLSDLARDVESHKVLLADLFLVAQMHVHGVDVLCTSRRTSLRGFGISVRTPAQAGAG